MAKQLRPDSVVRTAGYRVTGERQIRADPNGNRAQRRAAKRLGWKPKAGQPPDEAAAAG